jgi:hypothetical protein
VIRRRHKDAQVFKPNHEGLIFKKLLKLSPMLAGFSAFATG